LSFNWNVPILLSIFKDIRVILKIITSILLERSIIFISRDPAKLSSVILGFLALIKPFNWCYTLAINLPEVMLGILFSPLPMIIGIS
jgi:hypothetical protein